MFRTLTKSYIVLPSPPSPPPPLFIEEVERLRFFEKSYRLKIVFMGPKLKTKPFLGHFSVRLSESNSHYFHLQKMLLYKKVVISKSDFHFPKKVVLFASLKAL